MDKSHSVHESKAVHREKRRYYWTKIHPFGVNNLKASTDNVKQLNWDLKKKKKWASCTVKNGSFEVSFSSPCSTSEFQNEAKINIEASGGLIVQAQELSVSFRVEWNSWFFRLYSSAIQDGEA